MISTRINTRLSLPLATFVARMTADGGLYETPSEYIRDLIRRDMERRDMGQDCAAILVGYQDAASGKIFESKGDFQEDMKTLAAREASDWA